jgi:hypothetical protein
MRFIKYERAKMKICESHFKVQLFTQLCNCFVENFVENIVKRSNPYVNGARKKFPSSGLTFVKFEFVTVRNGANNFFFFFFFGACF